MAVAAMNSSSAGVHGERWRRLSSRATGGPCAQSEAAHERGQHGAGRGDSVSERERQEAHPRHLIDEGGGARRAETDDEEPPKARCRHREIAVDCSDTPPTRPRMLIERSSFLTAVVILLALADVGMRRARAAAGAAASGADARVVEHPRATAVAAAFAGATELSAVTAERLKQPADGDWLMVRRTYDGWGYSPLDQINTKNVSRLQPVWTMSTGMNNGHEAAPIVNGGVMFVSTSFNQVLALDAKSGNVLWRYRSPCRPTCGVSR